MSLIGVGIDIVELPRFRALYNLDDQAVLSRVFTSLELQQASSAVDPIKRLAARYAAKEAALKVLGGMQQGTAFTDIEIQSTDTQPVVFLSGEAALRAEALSVRGWYVSVTHTENSAAAVVIASA